MEYNVLSLARGKTNLHCFVVCLKPPGKSELKLAVVTGSPEKASSGLTLAPVHSGHRTWVGLGLRVSTTQGAPSCKDCLSRHNVQENPELLSLSLTPYATV